MPLRICVCLSLVPLSACPAEGFDDRVRLSQVVEGLGCAGEEDDLAGCVSAQLSAKRGSDAIVGRLDGIDVRLDGVDTRVDGLQARLAAVEKENDERRCTPVVVRYGRANDAPFGDGAPEVVNFNDLVVDELDLVTTGADWTFRAPEDGVYSVHTAVEADVGILVSEVLFAIGLYVNGDIRSYASHVEPPGTVYPSVGHSDDVILTKGQHLDVRINQAGAKGPFSTTASHVANFISITRLCP